MVQYPSHRTRHNPRCSVSVTAYDEWTQHAYMGIITAIGLNVFNIDSDSVMFCLKEENLDKYHHPRTLYINDIIRYVANQRSLTSVNTYLIRQMVISSL